MAELRVRPRPPFSIDDLDVRRLVPDALQDLNAWPHRPGEVHDGPPLPHARGVVLNLERVAHVHVVFDDLLSKAYSVWHEERDRALYHLIIHVGAGAHQAVRVLRATTSTSRTRDRTRTGRLAWAHATYAAAAEARVCAQVAQHRRETITQGREFQRAEQEASHQRGFVESLRRQGHADHLTELAEEELANDEAQVERTRPQQGHHYGYGGAVGAGISRHRRRAAPPRPRRSPR